MRGAPSGGRLSLSGGGGRVCPKRKGVDFFHARVRDL
jgi:hypothetical protein